jgi:hypothetical protein
MRSQQQRGSKTPALLEKGQIPHISGHLLKLSLGDPVTVNFAPIQWKHTMPFNAQSGQGLGYFVGIFGDAVGLKTMVDG